MRYRHLGKSGLKISELAIGGMPFGKPVSEKDSIKVIDYALSMGVNYIDTADQYNDGVSEEIIGKAVQGKRDSLVIATKVGAGKTGPGVNATGASRKNIMQGVEASLRRLKTDYIDIYTIHLPDYDTPSEETLRTLDNLVQDGKVRYIGCSNIRAFQLCKSLWISDKHNFNKYISIQVPYNVLTRNIEYEMLPLCVMEGVGVCSYNTLAAGLLTGKFAYNKKPPENSRYANQERLGEVYRDRYWTETNFKAIEKLQEFIKERGHNMAQFSIAWALKNQAITSVLFAADTIEQIKENLGALDVQITEEESKFCDILWEEGLNTPRFLYGR